MNGAGEFFLDVEGVWGRWADAADETPFVIVLSQGNMQFISQKMDPSDRWVEPPQTTFVVTEPTKPLLGRCYYVHKNNKIVPRKFIGSFIVRLSALWDHSMHTVEVELSTKKIKLGVKLQIVNDFAEGFLNELGSPMAQIPIRIRTGDIVLFHARYLGALSTSFFTQSKWNHVAIVVAFSGRMYLLEALGDVGVALNDASLRFEDEIKRGSTIGVRHLFMDRTLFGSDSIANLKSFLSDCLGKPYEKQIIQLIRAGTSGNTSEDSSSFFCSELVAAALKEMGLLDRKQKLSNNYVPGDFSKSMTLLKSAWLSPILEYNRKNVQVDDNLSSYFSELESLEISEHNRIIRIEDALRSSSGQSVPPLPSFAALHTSSSHGVVGTSAFGSFVTLPKEHQAWEANLMTEAPFFPKEIRKSGSVLFPDEEIVLSEQLARKATSSFPKEGIQGVLANSGEIRDRERKSTVVMMTPSGETASFSIESSTSTDAKARGAKGFLSMMEETPSEEQTTEDSILDDLSSVTVLRPSALPPTIASSGLSTTEMARKGGAVGFLAAHDWNDPNTESGATGLPKNLLPLRAGSDVDDASLRNAGAPRQERNKAMATLGIGDSKSSSSPRLPVSPRMKGTAGFTSVGYIGSKSMDNPTQINKRHAVKKEDGTLGDFAKSKGAVGFLSADISRAQHTPPKEGEKSLDVREMVKAKGAVGFLSFEEDAKSLTVPKKDDRSVSPAGTRRDESGATSRSISPAFRRAESNIRDVAKAGGAMGFLNVSVESGGGIHQNSRGVGSVSPSPSRHLSKDAMSPQIRPKDGPSIRDYAKSKGAVGFLAYEAEEESQSQSTTDVSNLQSFAKAHGAMGFMTFSNEKSSLLDGVPMDKKAMHLSVDASLISRPKTPVSPRTRSPRSPSPVSPGAIQTSIDDACDGRPRLVKSPVHDKESNPIREQRKEMRKSFGGGNPVSLVLPRNLSRGIDEYRFPVSKGDNEMKHASIVVSMDTSSSSQSSTTSSPLRLSSLNASNSPSKGNIPPASGVTPSSLSPLLHPNKTSPNSSVLSSISAQLSPQKPRRRRDAANITPNRPRALEVDRFNRSSQLSSLIPRDADLKAILSDDPFRQNFLSYLRSNHTSAPLDLWMEIEEFEKLPSDAEGERRGKYDAISAKYFKNNFTSGVSISSKTIRSLVPFDDASITLPEDIFKGVKEELYILLQYSSVHSYLKSDMYVKFVQDLDSSAPPQASFPPPKPSRASPLSSSPSKDSVINMVKSKGAMGFLNSGDAGEYRHPETPEQTRFVVEGVSSSSSSQTVDIREMVRKKGAVGFL